MGGRPETNVGPPRGFFDPPEAPKSIFSHRRVILDGFQKIDFLIIFDLFLPCTPIMGMYDLVWAEMGLNLRFRGLWSLSG